MPFQKGYIPWIKGKRKEEYPQLSNAGSPIGTIPWNRGLHPKYMQGENHPMYKDGLSKTKEGTARYSKEYRHRKGISKKYM